VLLGRWTGRARKPFANVFKAIDVIERENCENTNATLYYI
jgi:hypothetical protein